ncbi:hypothetical protein PGH07_07295 [Sulfurovum sp. zt1-1]|uniref:Uncharacterized protein n=1 Tax=Sulfurovum zhangzhouensis TaxID=3019067 RepID=A0ABT7QYR7_9BACT|nr:hypothetical protein [Sulfurovum zhangzhouensis]MDM5271979.1 hypothetical protein [Sulfurovum zhangzhouensis]
MYSKYQLLSLAAIPFLIGCGGSSSVVQNTGTQTATISGTVPGTKIEAFCADGTYASTNSVQNSTSEHPFTLSVPEDTECRLVMTTNENDPDNRIITDIVFIDTQNVSNNSIQVSGDIDLGYIDLPMEYSQAIDENGDHVNDTPQEVNVDPQSAQVSNDDNPYDSNHNETIDIYEDDDNDTVVNAYEDNDRDGTPNIEEDNDHDGIPDMVDDDDQDGLPNSVDDDDHDGTPNSEDDDYNNAPGDVFTTDAKYMLTAWNDLGMHCMDGNDYSVFSVLPPYNTLHAQIKDRNGDLVTSGIIITYESAIGTDNKWNTTSLQTTDGTEKTNFWDYVADLFGVSLEPDTGLTGLPTASKTPVELTFNETHQWWQAEGIPITPYNDDGSKNYYPLVKVVAKDSAGNVLAQVDTVLPVSDEMDCKRCHSSTSVTDAAKPNAGWVNHSDEEKDYKYNILRLHDEMQPTAVSDNSDALQAKGYNYDANGLEATAQGGTPVLCVACHKSNALPGVGIELKALTQSIHGKHADVTDPVSNMKLGDSENRSACYACHPGAQTECLRGAMGDAKDSNGDAKMQCQSCHGTMHAVGNESREGWLDQPNCQACHQAGQQHTSAIDPMTNTLRSAVDTRFATNPDTPMPGKSLYRFSKGHGNLQCEACHGSTHAIYPAHEADNFVSITAQGHTGTIAECTACHTTVPKTVTGGPHGLHPVGQSWVGGHEDAAENNPGQCKACHGDDYRGSVLSKTFTSRVFSTEWGEKSFSKGHQVSCYDCHNGPGGD